mmetsp:Transcript_46510/g.95128  ORF Transcript_46510/g.95128 Transcript_46510/m.95128 type:complete len:294 (-) Transcript_46510:130-1011(-)
MATHRPKMISARHRKDSAHVCRVEAQHSARRPRDLRNRDRKHSFLWTFVRDPAKRAISSVFHLKISRDGLAPTDTNIIAHLRNSDNQMTRYTTTTGRRGLEEFPSAANVSQTGDSGRMQREVKGRLVDYDFIGVVERQDESLVVLRLLLGLDAGDILYHSSKISGEYDARCVKIQKSFISPGVAAFLSSDEWLARNEADYMLFAAANRSLDATIDKLGRQAFEAALAEHHALMALAQTECADKIVPPCSKDGHNQRKASMNNCYWNDNGCGYPCLDEVSKRFQEQKERASERR